MPKIGETPYLTQHPDTPTFDPHMFMTGAAVSRCSALLSYARPGSVAARLALLTSEAIEVPPPPSPRPSQPASAPSIPAPRPVPWHRTTDSTIPFDVSPLQSANDALLNFSDTITFAARCYSLRRSPL
ncbi:hypothetical protein HYPSUDRAFT_209160 [Hypholoma sublateritium FD-334 SS-4]|uniref:Uncharacterized protein n=1 Tax=Hypholoma sublateritium (strain FD-334 SS-4) TaxID=945553 RepID=A0A0D2KH25_HYPSF|nr:hypothetical protein HYPSUDRAFT_209160 [Hypholoma sublateritium FD-334 SS-4]